VVAEALQGRVQAGCDDSWMSATPSAWRADRIQRDRQTRGADIDLSKVTVPETPGPPCSSMR